MRFIIVKNWDGGEQKLGVIDGDISGKWGNC